MTENKMEFDLITQKEMANMLKMSESWLEKQRWRKKGIPFVKIGGRIFYDKQDIVEWLNRHKNLES